MIGSQCGIHGRLATVWTAVFRLVWQTVKGTLAVLPDVTMRGVVVGHIRDRAAIAKIRGASLGETVRYSAVEEARN